MKKYGAPKVIVTDRLKSYRAAMKTIGNESTQEVGRWKITDVKTLTFPFDEENTPCCDFGGCEVYGNSSRFTRQSKTFLTKNDI